MKGIPDWAIALGVIAVIWVGISSNGSNKPDSSLTPVPPTPRPIESTTPISTCSYDINSLISELRSDREDEYFVNFF